MITRFGLIFAAVMCFAANTPSANAACQDDRINLRGEWGSVSFAIEVVDTVETRAQGLMHRESLAKFSGMLFVYDAPQAVNFWMRNTLIPLDMIFADESGVVTRVHRNAVPEDLTIIPGGDSVLVVLEINGGLATQIGIDVGTALNHPSFSTDVAVWPCE